MTLRCRDLLVARAVAALLMFLPVVLSAQEPPRPSVLNHVTVINPNGSSPLNDMAVVIRGGRIAAVDRAADARLPPDASVVDGRGKFVIPGIADVHNHLRSGALTFSPTEDLKGNLRQLLGWGVTTAFSMGGLDESSVKDLRAATEGDAAPFPRLLMVGRGFFTIGGYRPNTADAARTAVRQTKAGNVDAVKLAYDDGRWLSTRPFPTVAPDVIAAIVDEAHQQGLKAYVHAAVLQHAKDALRAGADGLVHGIISDPVDGEFIDLMKKNRAVYVSTLGLFEAGSDIAAWTRRLADFDERGTLKTMWDFWATPNAVAQYGVVWSAAAYVKERMSIVRANLKTVADAGIPIAIGTDTGFPGVILGVSSLMEVVLHVEAGLTPQAALRAATSTAAAMIGREKDLGTVEPGKLADLVVLDADPLADVRNIRKIHRVVKGGVIYDPAQLITVAR